MTHVGDRGTHPEPSYPKSLEVVAGDVSPSAGGGPPVSALTAADRVTLTAQFWGRHITSDASQLARLVEPAVDVIVRRHVTAALSEAADAIEDSGCTAGIACRCSQQRPLTRAAAIVRNLTPT